MTTEMAHVQSDGRMSFDRSNEPRFDEAPLPNPPTGPIEQRDSPEGPDFREQVQAVLQSDIGVNTLLNRLKQSIASAKDFAGFLRERSSLEEKHAQGLRKLCRSTHELIRRPDTKQGSFAQGYDEVTNIQDRMADHGLQFASSLHRMSDEILEMAANLERGRKQWKHTGTSNEQRLQDAEAAMGKAKTKYDVLADQYDRARTGDRQSGRFGLKTKSAAQQEEELSRKVQAADAEYAGRVQAAQATRQELVTSLRPQAVRALTELITESDSGLALQFQKFASLNEKLLLGNGLCISPLKNQPGGGPSDARSLRQAVHNINNDKDLTDFILGHSTKANSKPPDIKYEKHPALAAVGKPQPAPPSQPSSQPPPFQGLSSNAPLFNNNRIPDPTPPPPSNVPLHNNLRNQEQGPPPPNEFQPGHHQTQSGQFSGVAPYNRQTPDSFAPPSQQNQFSRQFPEGPPPPAHSQAPSYLGGQSPAQIPQITPHSPLTMPGAGNGGANEPTQTPANYSSMLDRMRSDSVSEPVSALTDPNRYPHDQTGAPSAQGPADHPRTGSVPFTPNDAPPSAQTESYAPQPNFIPGSGENAPQGAHPPVRPIFGLSLQETFERDGTAVSPVVLQCTMAVELFGLDTEGIYRTSGSAPFVANVRSHFDHDAESIDLRNPQYFHNDISTISTLLKTYLLSLPDPLLTNIARTQFLTAARIDDPVIRRDSLHALINDLPDPNYATLRHLTLHLHRVASNEAKNRMGVGNLAIVFGPSFMGGGGESGMGMGQAETGWMARVVETIVGNALQIFDEDE